MGSADQTAKVWDASSGREMITLVGHDDSVRSVAWSLDGKRLATGSLDHTTKVWDVVGGQQLASLRGHQGAVIDVAWSPDGKRLTTAGEDETVLIYAMDPHELIKLACSRVARDFTAAECEGYFQSAKCPPLP
jgi:WD40 repeat protein